MKRQSELIQILQEQLEATEQELADQKWILDQYLHSPSWRITAPLRWITRRLRALAQFVSGTTPPPKTAPILAKTLSIEAPNDSDASATLKERYSSFYRVSLEAFLASGATLDLPVRDKPQVSIILVLFNRAELTLACLRSIRENFNESFEVIIVDNASSDRSADLLDRIPGARIFRNRENLNFLRAVNQAAREARGEYILLLNNDAQLLPGALRAAINTLEGDNNIGAVGGRIVLLDGSLQEAGSIVWRDGSCLGYGRGDDPLASPYMFRRDVDYCSGALLLTPRITWEKLGGFDEAFIPAYYEETDYCTRLWEQGLRVVYEPAAVILHYEFASSESTRSATDLQIKHRQVFVQRHAATLEKQLAHDSAAVLRARMHSSSKKVLFIDDQVPHPWLGSGFPRARTLILALLKQGFFVTLFPMALLAEDWATVYSDFPPEVEVINENMGPTLVEAFMRHRRGYYDVIVVSRPHNMNFLQPTLTAHPDWFDRTPIIYDAEALFAPRDVRLRELRGEVLSGDDISKIYQAEVSLAKIADSVIAVSKLDRESFRSRGIDRVHLLGHALDANPSPNPFAVRSGFLFVGAIHEDSTPNGDSVIWFLSEIWPRIQAVLGNNVTLTVAGNVGSERIRSLANQTVHLLGSVHNLTELYDQSRVFIAPTRFAAGIPHKVHEAAAAGLPVVATQLLADQLDWHDGVEILVATDAAAFAAKCIELYGNKKLWQQLRETALDAIRRECSTTAFEQQLADILKASAAAT